jgi:hypothetical protein
MARDTDIKQDIETFQAAIQRLRDRRASLLDEIQEIDRSLENMQREIAAVLSVGPSAPAPPPVSVRLPERRAVRKDAEITVHAAVLQVIRDAGEEISKSHIRIRAMKLAGPFSESTFNSVLNYWADRKEIRNTSRGCYVAC